MQEKLVLVVGKVGGVEETHRITIPGIRMLEQLTPKIAAQAALIVFGHRCGVTVCDGAAAYRVYEKSYRKLPGDVARQMSSDWQNRVAREMGGEQEQWQLDAEQAAQDERDLRDTQSDSLI